MISLIVHMMKSQVSVCLLFFWCSILCSHFYVCVVQLFSCCNYTPCSIKLFFAITSEFGYILTKFVFCITVSASKLIFGNFVEKYEIFRTIFPPHISSPQGILIAHRCPSFYSSTPITCWNGFPLHVPSVCVHFTHPIKIDGLTCSCSMAPDLVDHRVQARTVMHTMM